MRLSSPFIGCGSREDPPQHPRQSRRASTPPPRGEYRQQDVCHCRPRAKPYAASAVPSPRLATLSLAQCAASRDPPPWVHGWRVYTTSNCPCDVTVACEHPATPRPYIRRSNPKRLKPASPVAALASTRAPTGCQSQLVAPRDECAVHHQLARLAWAGRSVRRRSRSVANPVEPLSSVR
jgi:hypothetical protein